MLDAIITVVDALHGNQQLDETKEAQAQVGFADRILISKTDLANEETEEALRRRLVQMNPRAQIRTIQFGNVDVAEVLDIKGFNLNAVLEVDPDFLESDEHTHSDAVSSFVEDLLLVTVERGADGALADEYYDHPNQVLDVVAVTGTNGKTSTSHWLPPMTHGNSR